MLEFEIDARLFSRALDAISVIRAEPAIVFEPAGMSIVTTDEAQIVLTQLSIRASEFDVYDVGDKKSKICFDIESLMKYMRNVEGQAMIAIDRKVTLMLPSKYGFKTFDSPLLAELPPTLAPTKMPHDSLCKIEIGALREALRDASILSCELLRFSVNDDNLDIVIAGEKGTARNSIEEGKGIIKSSFASNARFTVTDKYFKMAIDSGAMFTNIVKMSFAEQMLPIKFDFQVPFDGVLMTYLAPVVGEAEVS